MGSSACFVLNLIYWKINRNETIYEMFFLLLQLHVADLMAAINYMHENKKYGKVRKLNLLLFVDVERQSHVH